MVSPYQAEDLDADTGRHRRARIARIRASTLATFTWNASRLPARDGCRGLIRHDAAEGGRLLSGTQNRRAHEREHDNRSNNEAAKQRQHEALPFPGLNARRTRSTCLREARHTSAVGESTQTRRVRICPRAYEQTCGGHSPSRSWVAGLCRLARRRRTRYEAAGGLEGACRPKAKGAGTRSGATASHQLRRWRLRQEASAVRASTPGRDPAHSVCSASGSVPSRPACHASGTNRGQPRPHTYR